MNYGRIFQMDRAAKIGLDTLAIPDKNKFKVGVFRFRNISPLDNNPRGIIPPHRIKSQARSAHWQSPNILSASQYSEVITFSIVLTLKRDSLFQFSVRILVFLGRPLRVDKGLRSQR